MVNEDNNPDRYRDLATYEVLESDLVYNGRIANLRRDKVKMPGGNIATREVVEAGNSVAVVALDKNDHICLVHQYRHPIRSFVWEIPAGRMDVDNEIPLDTAKRELEEETSLKSEKWTPLAVSMSSPGLITERIHIFLAEKVEPVSKKQFVARNEESDMSIVMRPLDDVIADMQAGVITDAKTIVGLLLLDRYQNR